METIGEMAIICPLCGKAVGNHPRWPTIDYSLLILHCDHCGHNLIFVHHFEAAMAKEALPLDCELLENRAWPGWVKETLDLVLRNVSEGSFRENSLPEVDLARPFFCSRCNFFFSVLPDLKSLYFGTILFRCPGCGISNAVYHYGPRNHWHSNQTLGLGEQGNRFSPDLPDWLRSLILTSVRNIYYPGAKTVKVRPASPEIFRPITDQERDAFQKELDAGEWPPF